MIKSMTAYATAEKQTADLEITVEIRSVNSKYLDVGVRVPKKFFALEEKIKGLVSNALSRGRVEIKLTVSETAEDACGFELNVPRAKAYHEALEDLKNRLNIGGGITLDLMTGAGDIIRPLENENNTEEQWPVVRDCVSDALDKLNEMRKVEGAFLEKDLNTRMDDIEKRISLIEASSGGLLDQYRDRLKERIAALTRDTVELDPGRIAQEAAFLADRSDISEEIVRARSHVKQFRAIMDSDEPSGRKLNFLLQEFNREFNTIGSKTGAADISHMVVDLKSELEKIREQVQNIE